MTRPIHVLLVEDNPGDADLICDTLQTSAMPIEITVMSDGASATDYLLDHRPPRGGAPPDLVVLDLNLPKLDGRGVLAEMKKHARLQSVPVVVLTSSDAEADIIDCYEAGANCYITKPVDLATFQDVVRAIEAFWLTLVKLR